MASKKVNEPPLSLSVRYVHGQYLRFLPYILFCFSCSSSIEFPTTERKRGWGIAYSGKQNPHAMEGAVSHCGPENFKYSFNKNKIKCCQLKTFFCLSISQILLTHVIGITYVFAWRSIYKWAFNYIRPEIIGSEDWWLDWGILLLALLMQSWFTAEGTNDVFSSQSGNCCIHYNIFLWLIVNAE